MIPRGVSHMQFFWPEQRKQLEVLLDAILPGTQDSPGATDCGAAELVDRMLGDEPPAYYEVPAWRRLYVDGLAALDAVCRARHRVALADATPVLATELLADLAAGTIEGMPAGQAGQVVGATMGAGGQRQLFSVLRGHCIEGCFADPRWGGNRDSVMWRWYGYLGPSQPFHRGGER